MRRILIIFVVVLSVFLCEIFGSYPLHNFVNDVLLIDNGKGFEKTLLGKMSYKINSKERIYKVKLYANPNKDEYKWVDLSDVMDISTWHEVKSESIHTRKFEDSQYVFELYYLEDIFMVGRKKKIKLMKVFLYIIEGIAIYMFIMCIALLLAKSPLWINYCLILVFFVNIRFALIWIMHLKGNSLKDLFR
jgi:hypothetical protein